MDKLFLIIKREYLSRVTRPSFIIATLVTPLVFVLFFVIVGFIFSYESDDTKKIAVLDESGILKGALKDEKGIFFKFEQKSLDTLRKNFKASGYDAVLVLPKIDNLFSKDYMVYYYSKGQPTLDVEVHIKDRVRDALRDYKIDALKLERKQLEALNTSVDVEPEPIEKGGQDATRLTGAIGAGIGFIMGFIMYMAVFIYGTMVMRSVMEEKTNRIVEVMVSSVKPFQLMMGKIIGVGGVGLTQVLIWAIMIPLLMTIAQVAMGFDAEQQMKMSQGASSVNPEDTQAMVMAAMAEIGNVNWALILPLFIIYFLGGYFLYSSLFAAVGSAIGDDMGEAQTLTIPIVIPVVLAIYIMIKAVETPTSSLSVFSSIFPLFSPIVMPAILASKPPAWQIITSVILLIGTSIFFVWLSGRIYRVGILLYGKKGTFREFAKWIFYKE
ncbi:MAG: ABC transporter permease [Haliscomenobacter sp.]|nr:ABC transporter permease [Haliscomenobacter sp.]MBK9488327.1 ABC transporter permease [Haliscomenobacter sp.]